MKGRTAKGQAGVITMLVVFVAALILFTGGLSFWKAMATENVVQGAAQEALTSMEAAGCYAQGSNQNLTAYLTENGVDPKYVAASVTPNATAPLQYGQPLSITLHATVPLWVFGNSVLWRINVSATQAGTSGYLASNVHTPPVCETPNLVDEASAGGTYQPVFAGGGTSSSDGAPGQGGNGQGGGSTSPAQISLTVSPNPAPAEPNPLTFQDGPPNLVQNPTFDTGAIWGPWNPCCSVIPNVTTGSVPDAPSGTAATVQSGENGIWQHIGSLEPDHFYILSAYMDIPWGEGVSLNLEGGSDFSPSPSYNPSGSEVTVSGTGNWKQYYVWIEPSAGGNQNFHIYAQGAPNFTFEVAEVQVMPCVVIHGTVTDAGGTPVTDGTQVTLSSPTDPSDFPHETVVTADGGQFWAIGNCDSPGSQEIRAAAGNAKASVYVTVQ